ncbi:jg677 [Pararge aegeria aegeria]|uniref:Jg677 protein n=1 Tax=Pararge aegeria aegeria TaxID=348720 RepID=A0A8S4QF48_9NEOP|nr:jg677 [Pararge aegeria aegeria]
MPIMRRCLVVLFWFLHVSCAVRVLPSIQKGTDDSENDRADSEESYKTTRFPRTTPKTKNGDVIVEKFVNTLMESKKYLKTIEIVEDKLDHLESMFQERSNAIIKYLAEVLRVVKTSPADMLEKALQSLKNDLDRLKQTVQRHAATEVPNLRSK